MTKNLRKCMIGNKNILRLTQILQRSYIKKRVYRRFGGLAFGVYLNLQNADIRHSQPQGRRSTTDEVSLRLFWSIYEHSTQYFDLNMNLRIFPYKSFKFRHVSGLPVLELLKETKNSFELAGVPASYRGTLLLSFRYRASQSQVILVRLCTVKFWTLLTLRLSSNSQLVGGNREKQLRKNLLVKNSLPGKLFHRVFARTASVHFADPSPWTKAFKAFIYTEQLQFYRYKYINYLRRKLHKTTKEPLGEHALC